MASGRITSGQMDMETVEDFTFLDSKITADCDFKRCLFLRRKAMMNLHSIL